MGDYDIFHSKLMNFTENLKSCNGTKLPLQLIHVVILFWIF